MKTKTWGPRLRKLASIAACAAVFLIGYSGLASAVSFTDLGAIYTIDTPTLVGSDATTQTFRVTLDIDTTGYSNTAGTLNAVAVKITSAGDFVSTGSSLFSGPTGFSYAVGQTSAGGCSGNPNGFVCASNPLLAGAIGAASVPNGTYTFMWDVRMDTGGFFALADFSVKALYRKPDGTVSGQTSVRVPEPSSLLLFGFGLTALGLWSRMRHRLR